MEAEHLVNGFGGAEDVLMAQEVKLEQLHEENRVLGAAVEALQDKLRAAEARAAAATKRAANAEAKLHAKAAVASADAERSAVAQQEVLRLKHQLQNERVLMAERRKGAEQASAAEVQIVHQLQVEAARLQSSNTQLQEQLEAANVQLRQLESLQPFADSWTEQREAAQRRERELAAALDEATARERLLAGRCSSLERELASTAAALMVAQQLADSQANRQPPQQQDAQQHKAQRRQQRVGSLSLSDLCDLEGAVSQLDGCTSPQHSSGSSLPSRQHALNQRQAAAAHQQHCQQQQQENEEATASAVAAGASSQLSLVADLQQQLSQQQQQLAVLQLQQKAAAQDSSAFQRSALGPAHELEVQVQKLSRRNTQLQSALAEATLQHSRAAAAAEKQLQEVRAEAVQLQQRLDEVLQQLAALQANALGCGGGIEGSELTACSHEQLEQLGEVLEYLQRANELVAANAALVHEKRGWLEKLGAAEAEAERYRGEAQQLRLRLLPSSADEQVLQAVAAEAALRSLLLEARQELLGACRALSGELHWVHKLEELRIRDVSEVRCLHLRLHEAQQDCRKLAKALAATQQQLAAGAKRAERLSSWSGPATATNNPSGVGVDWKIAAPGSTRAG